MKITKDTVHYGLFLHKSVLQKHIGGPKSGYHSSELLYHGLLNCLLNIPKDESRLERDGLCRRHPDFNLVRRDLPIVAKIRSYISSIRSKLLVHSVKQFGKCLI